MAHFDRLDIAQACYLYGSNWHNGQASEEYRLLSRASKLLGVGDRRIDWLHLSENGQEIYARMVRENQPAVDLPVVATDSPYREVAENIWLISIEETRAYVLAPDIENALDSFVEWLDDNAPGHLEWLDVESACRKHGLSFDDLESLSDADYQKIYDTAGVDMYIVGHTTLKNGDAVSSTYLHSSEVTDAGLCDRIICQALVLDLEALEDE